MGVEEIKKTLRAGQVYFPRDNVVLELNDGEVLSFAVVQEEDGNEYLDETQLSILEDYVIESDQQLLEFVQQHLDFSPFQD